MIFFVIWGKEENEQKKMFQRIEFFSKMKMLESWTYNMIKNLFLVTDQRRYFRNQRVFEEGDEPEALYMIKFGEFTVDSPYF